MQIQITSARSGNWYLGYIDSVFDAEINSSGKGFSLIDTPWNRNILGAEVSNERKEELFRRLANTNNGSRLGVAGENAVALVGEVNNKNYKTLLGRKW
jgi:hypothetical protein